MMDINTLLTLDLAEYTTALEALADQMMLEEPRDIDYMRRRKLVARGRYRRGDRRPASSTAKRERRRASVSPSTHSMTIAGTPSTSPQP